MSEYVLYPPKSVFPHRPRPTDWMSPIARTENLELRFDADPSGKRSIIVPTRVPWIDFSKYDWSGARSKYGVDKEGSNSFLYEATDTHLLYRKHLAKETKNYPGMSGTYTTDTFVPIRAWNNQDKWIIATSTSWGSIEAGKYSPIEVRLSGNTFGEGTSGDIIAVDRTLYKQGKYPKLFVHTPGTSTVVMITRKFEFYFDGSRIVTNIDFTDDSIIKNIYVRYQSITRVLKVKCKLFSNSLGMSYYTPTVDSYRLSVTRQKV